MKDILTSPRVLDMKRKSRVRNIRLSVLIFVLLISIVYALGYFSSTPSITIDKIVVTGTRIINPPDVESIVLEKLKGKYLYLFYRSNTFIYPKDGIYKELITTFPRIEKLSINRDNLKTLQIEISERSGTSLYCGKDVPLVESEIGENCYFVNNNGYVFDKAPYFSGNIYFKYYVTLSGNDDNPMGTQMLPSDLFHKYVRFIDGITMLGFKPIYLVLDPNSDNSLYLDGSTSSLSHKIIFKNENDLENILDNLSLSMAKSEFANEINSKYTTLLYIDLRFKNKVLYKFNE